MDYFLFHNYSLYVNRNDNALRTMNMDNLSKTLPIVQQQFDSLLDFAATSKDLNNSVIMAAFRLLYKDLVRLYVAYQEAIINLLERYFKLSRKKTREALEMYKKYLARMDKVATFLQVVDAVGLDKSEMPDLTKSPASILNLLEQHLAQLEAKKRGNTPVSPDAQAEDEEVGENKENEKPTTSQPTKEVKSSEPVEEKKKPVVESKHVAPKEEPSVPEKHVPPQKPARPSPKASPKVSPSDSKSPPGSTAKQPVTTTAPAPTPTAVGGSEKKGPPERPAKPPSRPPPPSASAPTPTPAPSSSSSSSGPMGPPTSTKPTSHTPPPPHPPPPTHLPATLPTASQPDEHISNNANSNGNENTDNNNKEAGGHEGQTASTTTCSAATMATAESSTEQPQQVDEAVNHRDESSTDQEVETNHVNNINQEVVQEANVAEELEMPPPPEPLEEEEPEVAAAPVEEPEAPQQVGEQEPVVNGQSTNGAD